MSAETITQQEIPAGTWVVDPVHSSVGFAVAHNGVTTFRSGFERYDARLSGGEQPRLEGTVEVESIAIDEEMLKGHLLSPEFFDTQRFPQLRFTSTELSAGEDGSARIAGELEIRGEKRQVEASGRFAQLGADLAGKERVGLSLEATVDRRDFGLDWQAQLPSGGDVLEYAVTIVVELELVREEA
ncbi:MAG TPA: YceI family protein [Solirubrobacterales bacterium]|nr:YceI family protein [Solirubrobacterales bacterium]